MTATFHTSRNDLEDGSATFNVYASDEYGQTLLAEPPSEVTAIYLAEALTTVRHLFIACGSDRQVISLTRKLDAAFESVKKDMTP